MKGKSWAMAAAYGANKLSADLWSKHFHDELLTSVDWGMGMGKGNKRFDDMRQIGGRVCIHSADWSTQRKLFVPRGKTTCLLYVKNARKRFEPLCVDGTMSSGRKWSNLELPDDYRRTDGGVKDGGHVTVMNIVDAARERILTGDKSKVEWNGDWT